MRTGATLLLPGLLVLIGVALVARTLEAGGGPLAFGLLMGLLFVAAGVGRLLLERRR
jgi:hypothetical protein